LGRINHGKEHGDIRETIYWVEEDLIKTDEEKSKEESNIDSETVDEIRKAFEILDEDGSGFLNK
jgi:hypothetical protein